MKKGDIVEIFQRPLTEEDREGMAELLECTVEDMGTWEGKKASRWLVRFLDDTGDECQRTILETDHVYARTPECKAGKERAEQHRLF